MTFNIGLAQIKCNISDLQINKRTIIASMQQAAANALEILLLPEMCTTGYGIADQLLDPDYHLALREINMEILEQSAHFPGLVVWGTAYPQSLLPKQCFAAGIAHNMQHLDDIFANSKPSEQQARTNQHHAQIIDAAIADTIDWRGDMCKNINEEWGEYLDIASKIPNGSLSALTTTAPNQEFSENGPPIYNVALAAHKGKIIYFYAKSNLPNYGVFQESRYFTPGTLPPAPLRWQGHDFALVICEDLWKNQYMASYLTKFPQVVAILALNASPYHMNKLEQRLDMLNKLSIGWQKPIFYVNQVGAQNHLIFDGGSLVWHALASTTPTPSAYANPQLSIPFFCEQLLIAPLKATATSLTPANLPHNSTSARKNFQLLLTQRELWQESRQNHAFKAAQLYQALLQGIREYLAKAQIKTVLLGLSGGMDSALVATLAADALGAPNVFCVTLPSSYTSSASYEDAAYIGNKLGCNMRELSIEKLRQLTQEQVASQILNLDAQGDKIEPHNVASSTWENIQARLRGILLMALANAENRLLLATGNKSEMAMGYTTLYGDMCGGLAPIADLYKTQIYALAAWRNQQIPAQALIEQIDIFPKNIFLKEPSAELKPQQIDRDNLLDYALLDRILYCIIEQNLENITIAHCLGISEDIIAKIRTRLNNNEFKRQQACCSLKVSQACLNFDRRYPL